ncbi:hypothetical protein [Azotobacter beijerinckii]|uniref:hypothetical protein n=1 Tax=Azotobacter beijerinckii TaxID=170623 RepID=UPI00116029CC|nr:hypothetical protein [Azotobacter beijerinckii]
MIEALLAQDHLHRRHIATSPHRHSAGAVMVIQVPRASCQQRQVLINVNPLSGNYKRNILLHGQGPKAAGS